MHPARPPVSIQKLIEALEFQNDELSGFVNPETGEVVLVSDEALGAAETQADTAGVDDEELEAAQAVLATPGILPLPDRFEVDEYHMMVRFADAREETEERDLLRDALRGSGAFRRFKDLCYSLDVAQAWYAFRDAEFEAFAIQWCEEHGLAWVRADGPRAPEQPGT